MDLLVLKISSVLSARVQLLMSMTTLEVEMLFEMFEVLPSQKAQISLLRFPRQINDPGYRSIIWIRSPLLDLLKGYSI